MANEAKLAMSKKNTVRTPTGASRKILHAAPGFSA
jgi:hypothetical protein